MFRLIKNELIKIFSKKSTYIFMIVILVLIFTTTKFEKNVSLEVYNQYADILRLSTYYFDDVESIKSSIETQAEKNIAKEIREKYGENSWQEYVIQNEMTYDFKSKLCQYEYIKVCKQFLKENKDDIISYNIDINELKPEYDEQKAKAEYDEVHNLFASNDWKKVAKLMIEQEKEKIKILEDNKNLISKDNYYREKTGRENKIEELELRINKDIKFGYDYLNYALNEKSNSLINLNDLLIDGKEYDDLEYVQKVDYQETKERIAKNDYVINTKHDTQSEDTVRYRIANVLNDGFTGLLVIFSIIAISSSIMSSEFNKDTMKQLAIKPFSRTKIYFAKLITCFIMTILICLFMIIATGAANLVFFGTKSLENPMTVYNFTTNTLMEMGIFRYIGIQFLVNLPMYISVILISFALGTIFGSTSAAAIITILIYMGIGQIILPSTVPGWITNKLLTTNWDFSIYLFGKLPLDDYYSFSHSVIVCLVYYVLALFPSLIFFKKGDIGSR